MIEEQEMIYAKAQEFLKAAKFNLDGEQYGTVLNRAYYTVFTCSQLMLFIKDVTVKTHTGNHRKFNQTFVKTNIIPKEYGRSLNELYEMRQATDYDAFSFAEKEDAEEAYRKAHSFFEMMDKWLFDNTKS